MAEAFNFEYDQSSLMENEYDPYNDIDNANGMPKDIIKLVFWIIFYKI
jgi:hypothetical protein